jgi:hypothetical protein
VSDLAGEFDAALRQARAVVLRDQVGLESRIVLSADSAREYWRAAAPGDLSGEGRRALESVDWAANGEWAGLVAAMRSLLAGRAVSVVLAELDARRSPPAPAPLHPLIAALEAPSAATESGGLSGRLHVIEREQRRELRAALAEEPAVRERLARRLNLTPGEFSRQLAQIDRVRSVAARSWERGS